MLDREVKGSEAGLTTKKCSVARTHARQHAMYATHHEARLALSATPARIHLVPSGICSAWNASTNAWVSCNACSTVRYCRLSAENGASPAGTEMP